MTLGETPETAEEEIRALIHELADEDEALSAEVSCPYGWYPTLISEEEPIVRALVNAVEAISARRPHLVRSRFHTDGGLRHHMIGLPVVIFGPGREELAHIDEYIEVNQVVEATKIYAASIARFLDCRPPNHRHRDS